MALRILSDIIFISDSLIDAFSLATSSLFISWKSLLSAMSLKLAGASYSQIAMNLGYHDASGARKAVQRGMKNALHETSSELKKIHYGRLEHMLMLLWPDVNTRDLSSMSAALAVMDRMERLYGLNAAEKIDVSTGQQTVILADGDKESYINALREAGKRLAIDVSSSSPLDSDEDDEDDDDSTYTSEINEEQ